jgi:hypothetical protein
MKKIFKSWRRLLNEAKEQPLAKHYPTPPRKGTKNTPRPKADVPGDAMTPADPKKLTPSGKMARRINIKKSRRGDGLGVTKPGPTTEGADSTAFGPEINHIAAWMLGGIRNRSQVEDELAAFNVDRTSEDRDKGYSDEELTDIWTAASKMMMDM